MTMKFQAADQMIDSMLQRFLEILFKLPFESWPHIGQEFASVILAYTILLAYGKMLSAICYGTLGAARYMLIGTKRTGQTIWRTLWTEPPDRRP